MPSARANIIAKFIAQIETGTSSLMRTSEPAEATNPASVRSSGRPAATRAPNASTRIAMVTGHENSSDLSMASRLASLKSDQSREDPVGLTWMPSTDRSWRSPLRSVATRTISLVSAPAPARTMAVLPSGLSVAPGMGATTSAIRGSPSRISVTCARTWAPRPSVTGPSDDCTTTWIAEDALPPKLSWASSRAATDSEPSACQPAPERLCSTWGANMPRPAISSSQMTVTSFAWWVTQTPSRPRGPGREFGAGQESVGSLVRLEKVLVMCVSVR